MKRIVYVVTNLLFIGLALALVNYAQLFTINLSVQKIFLTVLLFLIIHAIKFARMYLILLEDLISPKEMLKLYIKTTFVSTVLPFKSGELFKMYSYGFKISNYPRGVMAVLIEKFFDALVLCLILIPYSLLAEDGSLSPMVIVLMMFLAVVSVIYFSSETTCRYLNKFLITRTGGKKGVAILKGVDEYQRLYRDARQMLAGRGVVYLILGLMAWIVEGGLLTILSDNGGGIQLAQVAQYISDGFFGVYNADFSYYIFLCTFIFGIITVCIYIVKFIRILIAHQERRMYEKGRASL